MEEILAKLVSFPTVTGDLQANHQALDYIANFVNERGMFVERFDSNGVESLVATVRPGHKTPKVMLSAHLDVVPAPEELFELRSTKDTYYGRGVLDMKCALAAYLHFIDTQQHRLQDYDFGLLITTDEESGGGSVEKLLNEGYLPSVCILPDGGDDWQIQVHSKGFLYLTVSTQGVTAHGSRPWLGQDATSSLLDALQEMKTLFPEPTPDATTFHIGIIKGGHAVNQISDFAEAQIDIRLAREEDRSTTLDKLNSICKKYQAELTVMLSGAVGEFKLDNPYIASFAQLITEVTGTTVTGSRTLGSNDARHFGALGIPCISFYPPGGGHHGPNEYLDKQGFMHLGEILQRYLDKTALLETQTRPLRAEVARDAVAV
jgi:acetylornithine deacetylase/succinyl-diaminopimelate desuccinylase-like protein